MARSRTEIYYRNFPARWPSARPTLASSAKRMWRQNLRPGACPKRGSGVTQDQKTAAAPANGWSLDPSDYTEARYQDWPIGEWIRSTVYTHLRVNTVDLGDQRARTTFVLERLFDEEKPDAQLLFNGRMGPTRIALEFAKRRGIRSIVE